MVMQDCQCHGPRGHWRHCSHSKKQSFPGPEDSSLANSRTVLLRNICRLWGWLPGSNPRLAPSWPRDLVGHGSMSLLCAPSSRL